MWVLYKLLAAASDVMSGGKRVIYSSSSVVVLLMIILLILQIWVCCDCQAGAIRIFPTSNETEKKESSSSSSMVTTNRSYKEGDLLHKYFGGSSFNFNRTDKGLADDKRRVPSCPDPLHN